MQSFSNLCLLDNFADAAMGSLEHFQKRLTQSPSLVQRFPRTVKFHRLELGEPAESKLVKSRIMQSDFPAGLNDKVTRIINIRGTTSKTEHMLLLRRRRARRFLCPSRRMAWSAWVRGSVLYWLDAVSYFVFECIQSALVF